MKQQEITITLMNRSFPVVIEEGQEPAIQQAAERIQQKLQAYQEQFALKDEIYPLVMCCLDFAFDLEQVQQQLTSQSERVQYWLDKLEGRLDEAL
jgi:cell division protein ZapA